MLFNMLIELLAGGAYILVGALEVRRAHRVAGTAFITAGVSVVALMCASCAWPVVTSALADPTDGILVRRGTVVVTELLFGLLHGVAGAGLVLTGLVMLARKLDRLRGPSRF